MEEKLTNLRNELNSLKMLKEKKETINKDDSKEALFETIIEKEKENRDHLVLLLFFLIGLLFCNLLI